MLKDSLRNRRCILVCGGGGVGKTTLSASIALAATLYHSRVLVVTIDPAKRLAEAFGFEMSDLEKIGAPLEITAEKKQKLGMSEGASLSVGILNPKYVLTEILEQVLDEHQRKKLTGTLLYGQLSEMIYGLQEYTAYEWVTRMLKENRYDLIILDTPPAFHAKDFFSAPERITRLMESKVFQIFAPRKSWFFSGFISFTWLEKLLGEKVYQESRVFFETFTALRDRILERCQLLAQFFAQQEVEVIAVTTPESSAIHELEGLSRFLAQKSIRLQTIILNQVEVAQEAEQDLELKTGSGHQDSALVEKVNALRKMRNQKAKHAQVAAAALKESHPGVEVIMVPMTYSEDGFEILKTAAAQINET